jgi:diguanylate cyclase (GGDEF)-like protein
MSFSFRRTKKQEDVIVDRVTGAFNRRQLDVDIAAGLDTSGQSTATLMIDVDEFESYNGKRGNAKGDQVLERVAWVIMATVRTTDVVYRHEASTFCVLLPSTSDADAIAVADRIQSNVAKMPLLSACGVTIKVGVASGPAHDVKDAVDRAVRALDEAVRTGQPRILNSEMAVPTSDAATQSHTTPMPAPTPIMQPMPTQDRIPAPVVLAPPADAPFAPPVAAPLDAMSPPASPN